MRFRLNRSAILCGFLALTSPQFAAVGAPVPVKVTQSDGAANDYFGLAVAISADTMVVGAPYDRVGTNNYQGSATVFTRVGTSWVEQAKLSASDGAAFDYFGLSVAISGETIIVGAPNDNVGANSDQGSAYIFTRAGTVWTQQARLNAADGAPNDLFGGAVSISGDSAIAGAYGDSIGLNASQGSAYVFVRSGTAWAQQTRLIASDGVAQDSMGVAVSMFGDHAVVGSPSSTVSSKPFQGSAYVFFRIGSSWSQQSKLIASDGAANDTFGSSVAINADSIIVGATNDIVAGQPLPGSAYIFTRSGTAWPEQKKLTPNLGLFLQEPLTDRGTVASGNFGISVGIDGDTAVIGAFNDTVGLKAGQGAAYVFSRSESDWVRHTQLTSSDGAAFDNFGTSVAISGDTIVAGACGDDILTNANQGSAWIYILCPADLNNDGLVDDSDFVVFVQAYDLLDCADPAMPPSCPADFNADGIVEDADFVAFASAYNTLVCP
jgi:hypothetical protein